ncbi:hypothetical protein Anas_01970 [Armadillidium nasatum]|uniref:Uncharacterized protein n=1 Tax=Armadillidium nasatum TaxID=96803 RepID=A0A5N5SS38_9CRUS|nr:hypothetical protein Anas_01970 [Armadillidium nasatum]
MTSGEVSYFFLPRSGMVVGMTSESFEAMQSRYRDKFDGVQDIFRGLVPFDSEDAQRRYVSAEEKENINILEEEKALETPTTARRRLRSSTLQVSFFSHSVKLRISCKVGRIVESVPHVAIATRHLRVRLVSEYTKGNTLKKLEEEALWMARSGCLLFLWKRKIYYGSTVEAVKNLLMATKEERSKRGKYLKYTQELRDQIAQYALDHSIPAATTYWSTRLGNTVSESSIRNFIRNLKNFSPETKEEIGKYAFHNGIEKAIQYFSDKLGITIRKGIKIHNENSEYLPGEISSSNTSSVTKRNQLSTRHKRSFSHQIKEEIGRYASLHSITAAIDHFTVKLQFPVKESTVRKFKRAGGNPAVIPMNPNSLTFHQGGVINPGVASLSYQQTTGGTPAVIMNQAFPQVGHPSSFQQGYLGGFAPSGTGNNGVPSQGTPLAIAHTSSPSSMVPHNSPLQLTMGGSHSCQINSVSVAQSHTMGAHALQAPTHSGPHQLVASAFHQHVQNGISYEGVPALGNHSNVTLNSEPLSLMKGNTQGVESLQQGENVASGAEGIQEGPVGHGNAGGANGIPEGTVSVSATVNGIPASIIHISHLETPSHPLHHSQHPHTHQYHKQDQQHQQQQQTQHHHPHQHQHQTPSQQHQQSQPSNQISTENALEEEEVEMMGLEDEYSNSPPPTPKRKRNRGKNSRGYSKSSSSSYTCGKRGNYVSYSPELRAEIGKYAAEHGNLAAITHFKEKLNIEIPESTVRGLKDKYMIKKMRGEKDVKSLGFAQRGRPMRLGKYDSIVQECIKELLKGGEKSSLFQ